MKAFGLLFGVVVVVAMGALGGAGVRGAREGKGGKREVVFADDFRGGLGAWRVELEKGGKVTGEGGRLVMDVAGGCTVWLDRRLEGPVVIEYMATVISAGGANDRVSDLNCFWMATNADGSSPVGVRAGAFGEYDTLRGYYVGVGGNGNTTTRFRRYVGVAGNRPMRAEHDLRGAEFLLEGNRAYRVRVVADGGRIEFWRDGKRVFLLEDGEAYRAGYFGFRTVGSRIEIRDFSVSRPGRSEGGVVPVVR